MFTRAELYIMICVEDVDLNLNRHLFYKNLEHGMHIDSFGKSKNSYLPTNIRDEDEKQTYTPNLPP